MQEEDSGHHSVTGAVEIEKRPIECHYKRIGSTPEFFP